MEIGQFLRSRPRLTVIALLFPLLAALGAWVVLANQSPRYATTATVSVPGGAAESASRVGIFVADFAELATSAEVVRAVSASTGVSGDDVEDDLEVARIGQASLFTVTWTGEDRAATTPVVRSVVEATFARQLPVARTDATLDLANRSYQEALAERRAYEDEIGTLQPDRDYQDVSSRLRSLQAESPATSALLQNRARDEEIAALSAQRDALTPQIRRVQELDQAVSSAASQVDEAERSAASARQDAQEASSPTTILSVEVVDSSTTARTLQGVGVAAVVGLLVGIGVLVLPDVLGRRRTREGVRDGEPAPGSASGSRAAPAAERAGDLQEVGHGR